MRKKSRGRQREAMQLGSQLKELQSEKRKSSKGVAVWVTKFSLINNRRDYVRELAHRVAVWVTKFSLINNRRDYVRELAHRVATCYHDEVDAKTPHPPKCWYYIEDPWSWDPP
jgi:hypothetical protein